VVITRLPSSNVDTLEGALMHMLTVCGPLSDAAINVFAQEFAATRGKRISPTYGTDSLIPRLARSRRIYRTAKHLYSTNPMLRQNQKGLDAFWVFLENMQDVDLGSVYKPRELGQLTYVNNNIVYWICRCPGDGAREMALAAQHELLVQRRNRREPKLAIEERFIFVFSNKEAMRAAPFSLNSPTLLGTIEYRGTLTPTLWFEMAGHEYNDEEGEDTE